MKHIILIVALLLLIAGLSLSQELPYSRETSRDTLPALVTAYSPGQQVRGSTANKIVLATPAPRNTIGGIRVGKIKWLGLQLDSIVANGLFEAFALSDTAGMGALLSTDHTEAEMRDAMGDNLIGSVLVPISTLGAYANGARRSYGEVFWDRDYILPLGKTQIFWVIVARNSFLPSVRCVVRVIADLEAKS